ncbi:MAG: hypothetical protein NT027_09050, partial [Proteobacteria bacterium]|nr:hypothetical protein [Pseudomonadota bacterium]
MSIHNNSVNASEAAMAIDSPVLKVGIDPFSGASSDVSYSSALTEWILEKSNPPEMLFNSDSLVFGDERTFIVSSIVRPAVYRTGIIVVILPSIDSIRRYKRYLGSFDVRMASFDLAPTKAEKREIWEQLDDQEVDVILVSPGRLNSLRFRERLARRTIRHIVIGQAHLMSSWAHRFNPYYRQVGSFVRSQTSVRKVAHFWTADQKVYQDVSKCLGLINPAVSNANESVTLTPKLRGEVVKTAEERTQLINDFLLNHDCQGVIYAGSLKEIHDTKSMLAKRGEEPVVYRPGVDEFTLNRIREQFETGEIRIVIAQGPFLSTLEKSPGLEFVIFNGLPEALEFVGQELFAHETATPLACLCLASDRDFFHHRFVIDKSYPDSL